MANLKLIPFGGIDNVTKNMFVYEFGNDILIVDCGIGFPDEPSPKEELLLPDFSYLLTHRDRIRGLIITHAHFDHYGALPYLLSRINIPVFTSRLSKEFIIKKAEESGIKAQSIDFRLISHQSNHIKIGLFEIVPFHINHSVPESLGLFIRTPRGNIFHVADYKFDWTPVDEAPFDIQKASFLASQKQPLLLLSDCLGANKVGHTKSERLIQESFEKIINKAPGLVIITSVSSNISRIKQAIEASVRAGRKVVFLGRSVEESSEIARKLGYLSSLGKYILPAKKIRSCPFHQLTVIAAGCYAQSGSALEKLSQNKHHLIKLKKTDVVIFSADPSPPGVIVNVNKMIDNLSRIGAKVYYYEIQENLYVSGHGTAEDIKMLFALIKPKYFLPIGGDFRHMRAYQSLASKMGYPESQVILLKEKEAVEFTPQAKVVVK
jgi:ribonuclease J